MSFKRKKFFIQRRSQESGFHPYAMKKNIFPSPKIFAIKSLTAGAKTDTSIFTER